MTKYIKVVLLVVIVALVTWFIWDGFIKDKTPNFFPINDQSGQYTIIENQEGIFEVKYSGQQTFNGSNTITTMVGNTNYNLKQLINKPVIVTKGKFASGYKQQCIVSNCRDIGGPYAVINIEELVEVQK